MRRSALGMESRLLREWGEQVTLLIAEQSAPSTDTPWSVTEANASVDWSTAKKVPITAHVRWKNLGKIDYGAGGRTIKRQAEIEMAAQWQSLAMQAGAVQMSDGSILLRIAEELSEMQSTYTMTVEGYVNIKL